MLTPPCLQKSCDDGAPLLQELLVVGGHLHLPPDASHRTPHTAATLPHSSTTDQQWPRPSSAFILIILKAWMATAASTQSTSTPKKSGFYSKKIYYFG